MNLAEQMKEKTKKVVEERYIEANKVFNEIVIDIKKQADLGRYKLELIFFIKLKGSFYKEDGVNIDGYKGFLCNHEFEYLKNKINKNGFTTYERKWNGWEVEYYRCIFPEIWNGNKIIIEW